MHALAQDVRDTGIKANILRIAEDYEDLACQAAARLSRPLRSLREHKVDGNRARESEQD